MRIFFVSCLIILSQVSVLAQEETKPESGKIKIFLSRLHAPYVYNDPFLVMKYVFLDETQVCLSDEERCFPILKKMKECNNSVVYTAEIKWDGVDRNLELDLRDSRNWQYNPSCPPGGQVEPLNLFHVFIFDRNTQEILSHRSGNQVMYR